MCFYGYNSQSNNFFKDLKPLDFCSTYKRHVNTAQQNSLKLGIGKKDKKKSG